MCIIQTWKLCHKLVQLHKKFTHSLVAILQESSWTYEGLCTFHMFFVQDLNVIGGG